MKCALNFNLSSKSYKVHNNYTFPCDARFYLQKKKLYGIYLKTQVSNIPMICRYKCIEKIVKPRCLISLWIKKKKVYTQCKLIFEDTKL